MSIPLSSLASLIISLFFSGSLDRILRLYLDLRRHAADWRHQTPASPNSEQVSLDQSRDQSLASEGDGTRRGIIHYCRDGVFDSVLLTRPETMIGFLREGRGETRRRGCQSRSRYGEIWVDPRPTDQCSVPIGEQGR